MSETDYYVVYGTNHCRYCDLAKALLSMRGKDWRFLNVETVPMFMEEMREKVPNVTTVPQIFHGDIFVGGYTQLQEYLK